MSACPCPNCGSYRVESRLILVNPRNGRPQLRMTDLSLPILLVFIGTILYAAIESLLSPWRMVKGFGLIFLLLFLGTVLLLTVNYLTRDRYREMMRHNCLDCKKRWNTHIPSPKDVGLEIHHEEEH